MKKIIQKINTLTTFLFFPLISFAAALPDGKATNPSLSASKNLYQVFSFKTFKHEQAAKDGTWCHVDFYSFLINEEKMLAIKKSSYYDSDNKSCCFFENESDKQFFSSCIDMRRYLSEYLNETNEKFNPGYQDGTFSNYNEQLQVVKNRDKNIEKTLDSFIKESLGKAQNPDQQREMEKIINTNASLIDKLDLFDNFFLNLEKTISKTLFLCEEPLNGKPQADWHIHQSYISSNGYVEFFNDSKAKCLEESKEDKTGGRWHTIQNPMRISELEQLMRFFKHPKLRTDYKTLPDAPIYFFYFGELPFYPPQSRKESVENERLYNLPVNIYKLWYTSYGQEKKVKADGYYAKFMQKDSLSVELKSHPSAPDLLYPHQLCAPEEICDRLNHEDPLAFFMRTSFLDCDRLFKPQSLLSLDSTFTKSLLSIEPCEDNTAITTWWENDQKRAIVYQTVLLGYLSNLHEVFHYFKEDKGENEDDNYFDIFDATYMFNELSSYELAQSFQTQAPSSGNTGNNGQNDNLFFGTTAQTNEESQKLISLKLHIGPDTYEVKPKEKNNWPLQFILLLIANK